MHGPKPRSHAIKLNKKVRRLGFKDCIVCTCSGREGRPNVDPAYGGSFGQFDELSAQG
ncbi:hypothetical protein Ancab_030820 [Ancistrocladus abbreviatus]